MQIAEQRVHRWAQEHGGIIRRVEAVKLGMPSATIAYRVAEGRWRALLPGTYLVGTGPPSIDQMRMAALRWAGPEARLSHRSAAHLWGLDRGGDAHSIEITVPVGVARSSSSVIVHRSRAVSLADRSVVAGWPVTSVGRTLIDLAGLLSVEELELAVDAALREGKVTRRRLEWLLLRTPNHGHTGAAVLRGLVVERRRDRVRSESAFETQLLRQMRRRALPVPVSQFRLMDGRRLIARVDFAYPEIRVAIEANGFAAHGSRGAFERDARRMSELAARGWLVVIVTYRELEDDAVAVLDRIERTISAATRRLVPARSA